jgi:hypothetical protein
MSPVFRPLVFTAALAVLPALASAQSPSPTLPSDTLQANFAPRSTVGPMPELAPTLPSDTLKLDEPGEWPVPEETWREEESVREEEWVEPVRMT